MRYFISFFIFLMISLQAAEKELELKTVPIEKIKKDIEYFKVLNKSVKALKDTIKHYESLRLTSYKLGNYFYIGYGHLTDSIFTITKAQAEEFFEQDFEQNLKYFQDIKDVRMKYLFAALSYNIGVGKVKKSSVYKAALEGNEQLFEQSFLKFAYFNGKFHEGIYKRRMAELKAIWYEKALVR